MGQESATLAYDNVRLLRRGADARYVGATHEALEVAGEVVRLDGVRFIDHADGSARPGKVERDLRLLRAAVEHEPGDARSMFYLAQTLRDAGRHAEAGDWYGAASRRRLGRGALVRPLPDGLLPAGAGRRARLGHRLPRRLCAASDPVGATGQPRPPLRRRRQHDAALLLLSHAADMPWPEADRLFVERDAYDDAVREAISIAGYYSALASRQAIGRRACEALAVDADSGARAALDGAAQPGVLCAAAPRAGSGRALGQLDIALPPPFVAMNPSFTRDGAGYLGVVRGVNYRLDHGRYDIRDADGCVRTRNFLARLTADFDVVELREMLDRTGQPPFPGARIQGFEAAAAVSPRRGLVVLGDDHDDIDAQARATMVLLRLEGGGDIAAARVLQGHGDELHQKNWMPLPGERLQFVYGLAPAVVLDADADSGDVAVVACGDPGVAIEHWRGAARRCCRGRLDSSRWCTRQWTRRRGGSTCTASWHLMKLRGGGGERRVLLPRRGDRVRGRAHDRRRGTTRWSSASAPTTAPRGSRPCRWPLFARRCVRSARVRNRLCGAEVSAEDRENATFPARPSAIPVPFLLAGRTVPVMIDRKFPGERG